MAGNQTRGSQIQNETIEPIDLNPAAKATAIFVPLENYDATAGLRVVKVSSTSASSQSTTNSTTYGAAGGNGCQVNYSPISATNPRRIIASISWEISRATNNCQGYFQLQYSIDGSSWTGIEDVIVGIATGNSTSTRQNDRTVIDFYHSGVSDASPYYRIVYKCVSGTSTEAVTMFTGSYLRVEELGYGTGLIAGTVFDIPVTSGMTVTGWTIIGDTTGSIVVDVRKTSSYPNSFTSIAGTEKPTLSSAQSNSDNSLSTWSTTSVAAGDYLRFYVESISGLNKAYIVLNGVKA